MEKRLILAISLSILVMLAWSALMPKQQPLVAQKVTDQSPANVNDVVLPDTLPVIESDEPFLSLEQENFKVLFSESLAGIHSVIFKKYKDQEFKLRQGFVLNNNKLLFKKIRMNNNEIVFGFSDENMRIVKKFTIDKSSYSIGLSITISNLSKKPLNLDFPLTIGLLDLSSKNSQARFIDVGLINKEGDLFSSANKNLSLTEIKTIGFRDQYFTTILSPEDKSVTGYVKKLGNHFSEVGLNVQNEIIPINSQSGHFYKIYIGPQDVKLLSSFNPDWAKIVRYGPRFLDFISQILLQILSLFFALVHNWGIAIILLSITVYLVLYPLSIKQLRSMKEMQLLQPKAEEIRRAYKDNPQRMNKEIMELYRQHKVNPLGGCLPLLLQMPIFFALYNALMRSISLKNASFLWIKDLSEPDKLYVFARDIPLLGRDFNVLPIAMAIGMFIQQKISSASMSGTAAEQQKMMLIIMPVMFGLIFYRMPSGLVLYWFVNSILMMIFQLRMQRQK